jgi:2-polyprenyl-3-methyl-5-hydroxy-6-metoxy-1,4-benzoquinol methylase
MNQGFPNPNTDNAWSKYLLETNNTLLKSPFYIDKINKIIGMLEAYTGKFLDIGIGMGNLERKMINRRLAFTIYGVDISSKAISEAKRKLKGHFYKSSVYKLPFDKSFFNVVAILDVLEHIYQAEAIVGLKEVNRVLKKGGGLIVSVPLNENLRKLNKERKNFNMHVRGYSPNKLQKELELAGFEVIDKKYIYAFKSYYTVKSFMIRFLPGFRKPNLVIMHCIKK